MSALQLIFTLGVAGLVLWAVNTYLPMSAAMRKITSIVIVVAMALYLLSAFGVIAPVNRYRLR